MFTGRVETDTSKYKPPRRSDQNGRLCPLPRAGSLLPPLGVSLPGTPGASPGGPALGEALLGEALRGEAGAAGAPTGAASQAQGSAPHLAGRPRRRAPGLTPRPALRPRPR